MSLKISSKVFFIVIVIAGVLMAGCTQPSSPALSTTSPASVSSGSTPAAPPAEPHGQTAPVTSQPPSGSKPLFDSYVASGYMGDMGDIHVNDPHKGTSHSGTTSIQLVYDAKGTGKYTCEYTPPCKWSGVYWLSPANNWGNIAEGLNLTGYTKLTFWARGENGGEKAEFKVGGIEKKTVYRYSDSISPNDAPTTNVIKLSKDWKNYSIDLKGKDLTHVLGGFAWVTTQSQNPDGATIYLDDIQFE